MQLISRLSLKVVSEVNSIVTVVGVRIRVGNNRTTQAVLEHELAGTLRDL